MAPKRGPLVFLWVWTIGWCAICFPMALMAWTQATPWGTRLFLIPFVLIGLGAIYYTLRLHRRSALSRGARLILSDSKPRAGEKLNAELVFPTSHKNSSWLKSASLALHLVQYEEDRSGSGVSLIPSHALEQAVHPTQRVDGSWYLATIFDVPANAPATGAVRHGHSVVWQIELHETREGQLMSFELQMRAAAQPPLTWLTPQERATQQAAFDALDAIPSNSSQAFASASDALPYKWPSADAGERSFDLREIAPLDIGEQPAALARSIVHLEENTRLWRAVFPRKLWRFWALILAAASIAVVWQARGLWHANGATGSAVEGLLAWLLACGLIIASLHAWTKRWHLVVQDQGFTVDKGSALFKHRQEFSAHQSQPLRYSLVYETSGSGQEQIWHFSATIPEGSHGRKIAITPALAGASSCAALVHHFWLALAHRRMRFTAPGDEAQSGLDVSQAQRLSAWLTVVVVAVLLLIFTFLSPKTQLSDAFKPLVITDQAKQQLQRLHPQNIMRASKRDALLKAHRANLAQELALALANGADSNALDDDGMPLLIDAARSGHIELVRVYLQHGANVNIRHTANPNNHGDTALLIALYRNHWPTAQLLLASGADLRAKNRWDWGALHMAAQGDCIICMQWLMSQGFSPNEPAPASRGETPVMLAAGRNKLATLQWLVEHGGSLTQKDPYGNHALAWAEFFKKSETAAWIRQQNMTSGQ